ncbi:MAG: alkaline phosphatase [Bacteroidales bacterium]|nr:alkaline phosphatase [Bacteroidales bacterium]
MKRYILLIALTAFAGLSFCSCRKMAEDPKAKYIFLFIGDGMGSPHVDVTESYLSYKAGKMGGERLLMTQFPVYGTATTYSASHECTCSAAAGTALSTGVKTNNNCIGVDTNGNRLKSISYELKDDGYKIGIISTVPVNHATPAAFYASQEKRDEYGLITREIPESGFEFFASAGFIDYNGVSEDEDSAQWLERNGMDVCFGKDELKKAMTESERIVFCQEYNRGKEASNYESSGSKPDTETSLTDMLEYCLEFLGEDKPFFIMCEGGEIDWAAHANKTMPMIHHIIEFDKAISKAYEFYLKHPNETLIVVTADHETGGISIGDRSCDYKVYWKHLEEAWEQAGRSNTLTLKENAELNDKANIGWTTHDHTGGSVPVYAVGKGSERFAGRMDNTDIKSKILGD